METKEIELQFPPEAFYDRNGSKQKIKELRERSIFEMEKLRKYRNAPSLQFPFELMQKALPLGVRQRAITAIIGTTNAGKSSFVYDVMFNSVGKYSFLYYSLDQSYNAMEYMAQLFHRKQLMRMGDVDYNNKEFLAHIRQKITIIDEIDMLSHPSTLWRDHDYIVIDYLNVMFPKSDDWLSGVDGALDQIKTFAHKYNKGFIILQQAGKMSNTNNRADAIVQIAEVEGSHRLLALSQLAIGIGVNGSGQRIVSVMKQKGQMNGVWKWDMFGDKLEPVVDKYATEVYFQTHTPSKDLFKSI
jgi:hypothetical protein